MRYNVFGGTLNLAQLQLQLSIRQEISGEQCLQNDLVCIGWDVKPLNNNHLKTVHIMWAVLV